MTEPVSLDIAGHFPRPTLNAWEQVAKAELKGEDPNVKLAWSTLDGLPMKALYTEADAQVPPNPQEARRWGIREDFTEAVPVQFQKHVKEALVGGADALGLVQDEAGRRGWDPDQPEADGLVGLTGASLSTIPDLRMAVEGIDWRRHTLHLECGVSGLPMLGLLVGLAVERGADFDKFRGSVDADPLGELARAGRLDWSLEDLYREVATMVVYAREKLPQLRVMTVSTEPYHEAGATASQELAFALATAVEYLRRVEKLGPHLGFAFSASPDFFTQIAKLRAARLLWDKLLELHGQPTGTHLHVRSGHYQHSWLDPHSNLLRSALEGLVGILGGTDTLELAPYDASSEAARLARYQQLLLWHEGQLDKVWDPGRGSHFLETLTFQLAEAAWKELQAIEAQGGMEAALTSGWVAQRIEPHHVEMIGVHRYAAEGHKRPPEPRDQPALQKNRREHMARVRAGRDGADVARRLTRVASLAGSVNPELIETACQAGRVGATVGEITRAIRQPAASPLEIAPLPRRSMAAEVEAAHG